MTAVQEICGRIGLVTGHGLAGIIRRHYSRPLLFSVVVLLLLANVLNIAADLAAVASALALAIGMPYTVWLVVVTVTTLLLQTYASYQTYSRFLKYLTLSLLAYIITACMVEGQWGRVALCTLLPHFTLRMDYLLNIVAILGTTISPYLFFWQASQEVEEKKERGDTTTAGRLRPGASQHRVHLLQVDTGIGMLFSNLIMYFIIITAAATLPAHGVYKVDTATQAVQMLEPIAGHLAAWVFAAGIVGTGLLAVPVLAGSVSYAIAEALAKDPSLHDKVREARFFYVVLALVTLSGLLVNFSPLPPFELLYYTAVFNGICAPPMLAVIMLISNRQDIMGNRTNSRLSNSLGWLTTAIMTLAVGALLFSYCRGTS